MNNNTPLNNGDLVEFVGLRDPYYSGVWSVVRCFQLGSGQDWLCRLSQDEHICGALHH